MARHLPESHDRVDLSDAQNAVTFEAPVCRCCAHNGQKCGEDFGSDHLHGCVSNTGVEWVEKERMEVIRECLVRRQAGVDVL